MRCRQVPIAGLLPSRRLGAYHRRASADLTFVELRKDDRVALLARLPYVGPSWYAKPEIGVGCCHLAFKWGHGARGSGSSDSPLNDVERAWFDADQQPFSGWQWLPVPANANCHWDHIYVTDLYSNATLPCS